MLRHPGGNPDKAALELPHYALLPHEVFSTLAASAPELFRHLMGTPESLARFWSDAASAAEEHESRSGQWLARARAATAHVPLEKVFKKGIHGDDAGAHGHDKVLVVTWGSVAVDLPTMDSRLCFSMLRDADAVSGVTREKLYKVLTWSFKALATGLFPAEDEEGRGFGPGHHPTGPGWLRNP